MIRTLLFRGLLAGLLAGLMAAGFAFAVGEPQIDQAIALEEAAAVQDVAQDHGGPGRSHDEEAPVSRGGQRFGLFLALALYGLAFGGLFALAYAALRNRVGPRSEPALAIALTAAASVAVVIVPFVKYPANPPAVGDPGTIGRRTMLYLAVVVIGLLAAGASVACARLVRQKEPWAQWLTAAAGFVVPVALAWALLPEINEVPETFPANLLWDFRVASLGTQLVFWLGVGAVFAFLTGRAGRRAMMS